MFGQAYNRAKVIGIDAGMASTRGNCGKSIFFSLIFFVNSSLLVEQIRFRKYFQKKKFPKINYVHTLRTKKPILV